MITQPSIRFSTPFLLLLCLAIHPATAQDEQVVWTIGFEKDGYTVTDSSADRIRRNYQNLYKGARLTIIGKPMPNGEKQMEKKVEKVQELLWEGGIPPKKIEVKILPSTAVTANSNFQPGRCYLMYQPFVFDLIGYNKEKAKGNGVSDTVIAMPGNYYLRYILPVYRVIKELPEVKIIDPSSSSYKELDIHEKVNTRGTAKNIAFFEIIRKDDGFITDRVVLPMKARLHSSSLRLERYSREKSVWMSVANSGIVVYSLYGQECAEVKIDESGVYRLLSDSKKNTRVLYLRAPKRMAFVKVELAENDFTVHQGIITDSETGVLFILPDDDRNFTCAIVLKDGEGRVHYLPETGLPEVLEQSYKLRPKKGARFKWDGKSYPYPETAYQVCRDLNDVRTLTLEHVK